MNSSKIIRDCQGEEPIHKIGSIQPHGVLLVLQEPDLTIIQVSQNTDVYLGISPEDLLGKNIATILRPSQQEKIRSYLSKKDFKRVSCLEFTLIDQNNEPLVYIGNIHRHEELLFLELEEDITEKTISLLDFYQASELSISQIKNNLSFEELCHISAQEIRQLSGFDRVMIYQFADDWHGKVIAESKIDDIESYLGLRFPAGDVPPLSRHLFSLQPLRFIPDINYQPVGLLPKENPITKDNLDLSYSILRGVSPIHIKYLQNMGIAGSMTISILKDNQLWGLIACHHKTPKFVKPGVRIACKLFAKVLSLELYNIVENRDFKDKIRVEKTTKKIIELISREEKLLDVLMQNKSLFFNLFTTKGIGICVEDQYKTIGKCPKKEQIDVLIQWLNKNNFQSIFFSDQLSKIHAPAKEYKEIASGVFVIILSQNPWQSIFLFRPEEKHIVNWAGSPHDLVFIDENKELNPRNSFKQWQETVDGKSLPWQTFEIEAASELRKSILEIGFEKMNQLEKVNHQLEQKNQDLDAFAYIASHDLKEPLRGIYNYANFLLEDYSDRLDSDGVYQLETLVRLSKKMGNLLDSLLAYSRLGRVEFSYQAVNLNDVIEQVLDMVRGRWEENLITLNIPRSLPIINADRERLQDLYMNLVSNSIKYNDKTEKIIEIGYLNPEEMVLTFPQHQLKELHNPAFIFYVKDNGIGIATDHKKKIFQIFKRLHTPEEYGGGTGIGLTIVQKIVERHGGSIWIDSTVNQGTTFYFTLT